MSVFACTFTCTSCISSFHGGLEESIRSQNVSSHTVVTGNKSGSSARAAGTTMLAASDTSEKTKIHFKIPSVSFPTCLTLSSKVTHLHTPTPSWLQFHKLIGHRMNDRSTICIGNCSSALTIKLVLTS